MTKHLVGATVVLPPHNQSGIGAVLKLPQRRIIDFRIYSVISNMPRPFQSINDGLARSLIANPVNEDNGHGFLALSRLAANPFRAGQTALRAIFHKGLNMRSFLLLATGLFIIFSGCSNNDDMAQKLIEQQKLNLDTLKLNQEKLEKLNQREKEVAHREKEVQDALKQIESKKKELANKESEVKKLIEEDKKLTDEIKESNELAQKNSELSKKRTGFLDELSADWAKAALSAPHMPGQLDAELEKELDAALTQNKSDAEVRGIYNKYYDMAKTIWYNNIQYNLHQNDVIQIKSDEEFENAAKDSVEKFIKTNTSPDDFEIIEKSHLKILSEKKNKAAK
jgi:hypothetical protein